MAADTNPIGREAALERLVAEHQTALVRMCCLCLGDASLAEDAAQETFLKAYRALDSFRGGVRRKDLADAHRHQYLPGHAALPLDKARRPACDAGDAARSVGAV